MEISKLDEIRKLGIIAMFSDDDLMKMLVLTHIINKFLIRHFFAGFCGKRRNLSGHKLFSK